ncbi:DNA topoisomerase 3 [Zymoseptoria tritici IPO323]|uniref:DNA topoisomerase n=1 Tax=Zymoseptoria tritici (strain CBS 115943 / IPO323) TaxID=336722 RepID=F9XBA1_ZYMTI|nr:DNA topoisomerase 3 [Zymoseptoria tritici IPO323]EGP87686.1 hypothetical protein MYCGRDRAFT_71866 [Zymoseptoria tritici IPO323]
MAIQVLCVAEKPSIAKAVANHLGGGQVQCRSIQGNQFIKNYIFDYNFPGWGQCSVTMTSVAGHLMSHDFPREYKGWQSCDPSALFECRIESYIDNERKAIAANIENQAQYARYLYIWTDCDREGEAIGSEIRDVACKKNAYLRNPGKTVRARFSNIERAHIIAAARAPIPLDEAQAAAVASRIELDLRVGVAFTRNLSLTLQAMIPGREGSVISYGSCQFPTLGFVVERYFRVKNFLPETFWGIKVMHEKDRVKVNFHWSRGHLFDRMVVTILFERCLTARTARVTKVTKKPTSKWKPLPLTTVELQKCGSRFLRMNSQRVMQIAEKLYQDGFISYPRTETDQFDRNTDLNTIIDKQIQSPDWGNFAQGLRNGGFSWPRMGRNNDKAHPPIHPVNFVANNALDHEHRRVYEFIVRRFLACCSKDAQGTKTDIGILYGAETFNASGLMVLERNYLDVYPYDKWTSSQELPIFAVGETFVPTEARMHEGETTPPGYLTEPELIGLMDANGIGTDATMAEHIAKIKEREYVMARPRGRVQPQAGNGGVQEFIPTTLGVALIEGYESMGFEISLAKPFLRKEMELKMKAICEGRKTRRQVVEETIEQYRDVYMRTQRQLGLLRAVSLPRSLAMLCETVWQ